MMNWLYLMKLVKSRWQMNLIVVFIIFVKPPNSSKIFFSFKEKMKHYLLIFFTCGLMGTVSAQPIGFSYFFPTDGYFGNPIAPVKFHLPLSFGKFIRITPGIGMNNIGGMSMGGLQEYNGDRPLIGPFQSAQLSLSPSIVIPMGNVEVELMGGVFGFTSIKPKLNDGNFEQMLMEKDGYDLVQTDLSLDPDFCGWGWVFGLQLDFKIKGNIWGYVAGRYYLGEQNIAISGDYRFFDGTAANTVPLDLPDAFMNYHGFEITIGGSMKK